MLADQMGFFVLGRLSETNQTLLRFMERLSQHPSCLGWLASKELVSSIENLIKGCLLGVECPSAVPQDLPDSVRFLVGPPELTKYGHPLLISGDFASDSEPEAVILGTVR
jgi:hypothetical protein